MKNSISWKLFTLLLIASMLAALTALPYAAALSPQVAQILTPVVIVAQMIQSLILFSIAIFVGLKLGKKIGFGAPILEKLTSKERYTNDLKATLKPSILAGIITGILIIAFGALFAVSLPLLSQEVSVPTWMGFLASFYGGIGEEVLLRLFLMTLLVWLTWKIKKTSTGKPTSIGVWIAILVSSVIFGLGHLPITASLVPITLLVVVRAIVLNGIGGVIFGWLYWKKGLESAMIAHFTADIVIHVITPLIASKLI